MCMASSGTSAMGFGGWLSTLRLYLASSGTGVVLYYFSLIFMGCCAILAWMRHSIPDKANRILNLLLFAILAIMLRVWHLQVLEHDTLTEEAVKPRRRVVVEPAKRATIRDRFNIPLAYNKVKYQATITYAAIKEIPTRSFKRKEYIGTLSQLLGKELAMDPERIEDLIHAKAVFCHNIPFVIKEDISEKQYYRLKYLEKDYPGLLARRVAKRTYPLGRVGSHVIGYMGAISRQEYDEIITELATLRSFMQAYEEDEERELPEGFTTVSDIKKRLRDLEEHAYGLSESVGKSGVEGRFERELRGYYGNKIYYANAKGSFLHELPGGRDAESGNRLLLTLSAELQQFAEELLIQHEKRLEAREKEDSPWIRGGAIVVMDPKSGELLALAANPRFDPNDFIPSGNEELDGEKREGVIRTLEGEEYVGRLWDQFMPLERETFSKRKGLQKEEVMLTWDVYLDHLLPPHDEVRKAIEEMDTIQQAVLLQQQVDQLIALYGEKNFSDHLQEIALLAPLTTKENRVLLVDLARLSLQHEFFTKELLQEIGKETLHNFRNSSAIFARVSEMVKRIAKDLFHKYHFKVWRERHQKSFLKEKREEEKRLKIYPKPYLDYLDQAERELFAAFWDLHRFELIKAYILGEKGEKRELIPYVNTLVDYAGGGDEELYETLKRLPSDLVEPYFRTLRTYYELDRPLIGHYRNLRNGKGKQLEKHLAAAFYPRFGFHYARSLAYREATVQGSCFKLVTAYEALIQRYNQGKTLNPLHIVDQVRRTSNGWSLGYFADGTPIPRMYKGGRVPKSLSKNIGETDLITALAHSSNSYFAILAGDYLENPNDLAKAARLFGYGSRTGVDLPGEYAGEVPKNLETDRTGLYSMAIGQGGLVATPLQTAALFSAIANGGELLKPNIVRLGVGAHSHFWEEERERFPFEGLLKTVGLTTALFSIGEEEERMTAVHPVPRMVHRVIDLPKPIRTLLYRGMKQTVAVVEPKLLGNLYPGENSILQDYQDLQSCLLGKTSSSEIMEPVHLGVKKITHTWFAGIAELPSGEPELVVVIYTRFGGTGKEVVPLAAQIVKKWREIKAKQ